MSPPLLLFVDIVGDDKGLAVGELNTPIERRCKRLGGFVIDLGRESGRGLPLTLTTGKLETAGDDMKETGPGR